MPNNETNMHTMTEYKQQHVLMLYLKKKKFHPVYTSWTCQLSINVLML